jgi:hypothetical protein
MIKVTLIMCAVVCAGIYSFGIWWPAYVKKGKPILMGAIHLGDIEGRLIGKIPAGNRKINLVLVGDTDVDAKHEYCSRVPYEGEIVIRYGQNTYRSKTLIATNWFDPLKSYLIQTTETIIGNENDEIEVRIEKSDKNIGNFLLYLDPVNK